MENASNHGIVVLCIWRVAVAELGSAFFPEIGSQRPVDIVK
jgi:hypothetical protein